MSSRSHTLPLLQHKAHCPKFPPPEKIKSLARNQAFNRSIMGNISYSSHDMNIGKLGSAVCSLGKVTGSNLVILLLTGIRVDFRGGEIYKSEEEVRRKNVHMGERGGNGLMQESQQERRHHSKQSHTAVCSQVAKKKKG